MSGKACSLVLPGRRQHQSIPTSCPNVQNAAGLTGASNAQNGMFSVVRHEWLIELFMRGADMISVVEFACLESLDAFLPSAGEPTVCREIMSGAISAWPTPSRDNGAICGCFLTAISASSR